MKDNIIHLFLFGNDVCIIDFRKGIKETFMLYDGYNNPKLTNRNKIVDLSNYREYCKLHIEYESNAVINHNFVKEIKKKFPELFL